MVYTIILSGDSMKKGILIVLVLLTVVSLTLGGMKVAKYLDDKKKENHKDDIQEVIEKIKEVEAEIKEKKKEEKKAEVKEVEKWQKNVDQIQSYL